MMYRLFFLLIGLGISASCSRQIEIKQPTYDGSNEFNASKDQIIAKLSQKGDLEGVQTSAIDHTYEVVVSKSDVQYFVKNGKVVSFIRSPKGDERKLIYWRYQFKNKLYREQDVRDEEPLAHRAPLRQLACDSLGIGVVYDPSSETVKRIFQYDNR